MRPDGFIVKIDVYGLKLPVDIEYGNFRLYPLDCRNLLCGSDIADRIK